MALRLGIMIDRYNHHASRGRTVLLSVTPSLDGKLFGALFGVGLFLNPHLSEQHFLLHSSFYSQRDATLVAATLWDEGRSFKNTCSVSKGLIKALVLSILLEQPLGSNLSWPRGREVPAMLRPCQLAPRIAESFSEQRFSNGKSA